MTNTLYVVVFPGSKNQRFHLSPGRAIVVNKLIQLRDPLVVDDILAALPELYKGNDRDLLLAFLAEHVGRREGIACPEVTNQSDDGVRSGP